MKIKYRSLINLKYMRIQLKITYYIIHKLKAIVTTIVNLPKNTKDFLIANNILVIF